MTTQKVDFSKVDVSKLSATELATLLEKAKEAEKSASEYRESEKDSLRKSVFNLFKESSFHSGLTTSISKALDNIFNGADVSKADTADEIVASIKALGIRDLTKEFCFEGDETIYKLRVMQKPERKKTDKATTDKE
jgi:aspartate carbamoyltransferase catalytic subunit